LDGFRYEFRPCRFPEFCFPEIQFEENELMNEWNNKEEEEEKGEICEEEEEKEVGGTENM
jgi:hypothetical protein